VYSKDKGPQTKGNMDKVPNTLQKDMVPSIKI